MRNKLTILFVFFSIANGYSQVIGEKVFFERAKYDPLFGTNSYQVSMTLLKWYTAGRPDTSYQFVFNAKQITSEAVGGSIGGGLYYRGAAFGAAVSYRYDFEEKTLTLPLDSLDEFVDAANRIFVASQVMGSQDVIMYIEIGSKLLLGYEKTRNEKQYYFTIDGLMLVMDEDRFTGLMRAVASAKRFVVEHGIEYNNN